jgi:Tol biopolymer transport system component
VKPRTLRCMTGKATLVTLIALLLAVVLVRHAGATFLGTNGRIVFGRFNPSIGDDDIYSANPDGSHEVKVLAGPAECPHWSPDGNRIAVTSVGVTTINVTTINRDGSGSVLFSSGSTQNFGCSVWSADGSRIAFESWDDTNPNFVPGIFSIRSSDGDDLKRLTANPFGGAHDLPGDYSPDGSHLAFLRGNSLKNRRNGTAAMFVANADGTNPRQITPWGLATGVDGSVPRWSPDGSRIVFVSHGSVFLINPDGSGLVKVFQDTGVSSDLAPAWSPDGTRILFVRISIVEGRLITAQQDLYTINPDGTGLTQVTNTPGGPHTSGAEEFPDWGINPLQ